MRNRWLWGLSIVGMLVVAVPAYLALSLATGRLYAAGVAYALGFSAASVIQGTNGSKSGLLYHLVCSRRRRMGDFVLVAAVGTAIALAVGVAISTVSDGLVAELAVLFAAVLATEVTFGFRQPDYDQKLRSLREERSW